MTGRSSFIFGATLYPILSGTALAAAPAIGILFLAQAIRAQRNISRP